MKPSQKIIQEALDGEYAPLGDADVVTIPDAREYRLGHYSERYRTRTCGQILPEASSR